MHQKASLKFFQLTTLMSVHISTLNVSAQLIIRDCVYILNVPILKKMHKSSADKKHLF